MKQVPSRSNPSVDTCKNRWSIFETTVDVPPDCNVATPARAGPLHVQNLLQEAPGALVLGFWKKVFGGTDLDYAALVYGELDVLEDLKVPEELVDPVKLYDCSSRRPTFPAPEPALRG